MKSKCQDCGATENLQEHHISYDPEKTITLCVSCHKKRHNGRGVGPSSRTSPLERTNVMVPKKLKNLLEFKGVNLSKAATLGFKIKAGEVSSFKSPIEILQEEKKKIKKEKEKEIKLIEYWIKKLKERGDIFEPKPGFIRRV